MKRISLSFYLTLVGSVDSIRFNVSIWSFLIHETFMLMIIIIYQDVFS